MKKQTHPPPRLDEESLYWQFKAASEGPVPPCPDMHVERLLVEHRTHPVGLVWPQENTFGPAGGCGGLQGAAGGCWGLYDESFNVNESNTASTVAGCHLSTIRVKEQPQTRF